MKLQNNGMKLQKINDSSNMFVRARIFMRNMITRTIFLVSNSVLRLFPTRHLKSITKNVDYISINVSGSALSTI